MAAGASTAVTVSIESNASSLGWGSYSDTVTFTNLTNGNGNTTRAVTLAIQLGAGDFNRDGDVDGSDLAALILGNETIDIAAFALDFGRGD